MGNLDRIGVAVVVALLAVIIVVSFFSDGDPGPAPARTPENLGAANESRGAASKSPLSSEFVGRRPPEEGSLSMIDEKTAVPATTRADAGHEIDFPLDPTPGPGKPEVTVPKDAPKPGDSPSIPSGSYPKTVKLGGGESVWVLAEREYGPALGANMVPLVRKENGITNDTSLKIGTEIRLPAPPAELVARLTGKAGPGAGIAGDKPNPEAPTPKNDIVKKPSGDRLIVVHEDIPFDPGIQAFDRSSRRESTSATPVSAGADTHVLADGETLGHVALRRLGSTRYVKQIMELNGITDERRVRTGTVLRLPARPR